MACQKNLDSATHVSAPSPLMTWIKNHNNHEKVALIINNFFVSIPFRALSEHCAACLPVHFFEPWLFSPHPTTSCLTPATWMSWSSMLLHRLVALLTAAKKAGECHNCAHGTSCADEQWLLRLSNQPGDHPAVRPAPQGTEGGYHCQHSCTRESNQAH